MKKTAYYYLSLAAIVAGGLVSCQDENQGFTQDEISYAATQRNYTKNFIAKYGEIDPNHTWGFDNNVTRAWSDDGHGYFKVNRQRIANGESEGFESNMGEEMFNYWKNTLPPAVEEDEALYVLKYVYNHPDEGDTRDIFSSYYMQAVGKVRHTYTYKDNNGYTQSVIGCGQMDYLNVDREHNLDYNGGNAGWTCTPVLNSDGVCTGFTNVSMSQPHDALVVKAATTSPSYKDSNDNGDKVFDHYRYYEIEYPEGSGHFGTYLCFDYASYKFDGEPKATNVEGDLHFDDWVVKIVDAHRVTNRVFCEDLGSIHDWDFNDLVFDYCIEAGVVNIDVLAFSGTLPLGSDFADGENHILIDEHEPVGAESGHAFLPKVAPVLASYRFESAYTDIQQFAFWAVHNSTSQWETGKDNHDIPVNARWAIANFSGCAPCMIQVPTTVDWPDEGQDISDKYSKFSEYVTSGGNAHKGKFWE